MCGMCIINGVHGPEPGSSGGNTSSNPQVSELFPRPVFNGMERMCQRHGSIQNSHPPVLVRKPLCNQFIHYHISSRGVFGINRFKLRNFAVVARYVSCTMVMDNATKLTYRSYAWFFFFFFFCYRIPYFCIVGTTSPELNRKKFLAAAKTGFRPPLLRMSDEVRPRETV